MTRHSTPQAQQASSPAAATFVANSSRLASGGAPMADGMASEGLEVTVKLGDAGSFAFTSDDPHRLLSVLSGGGGTIKFRGRDRDSEITGDALILEKTKAARVEFGAATQTAVPQEVSFFFFRMSALLAGGAHRAHHLTANLDTPIHFPRPRTSLGPVVRHSLHAKGCVLNRCS